MATAAIEHDPETLPEPVYRFNGKDYKRNADTSVEQDAFVNYRLKRAGFTDMWKKWKPAKETRQQLIERMIEEGYESGIIYEIVGGALVEVGKKWSRSSAMQNAAMLRALTDPAEKGVFFAHVADILIDFLMTAVAWSSTFELLFGKSAMMNLDSASDGQSSATPDAAISSPASSPHRPETTNPPADTGETPPTTTTAGTGSLENSQTTTQADTPK